MNVFMNFSGHMDWRNAMHLLFEDRFGFKIYQPRGSKEWNNIGIQQPPHNSVLFEKPVFIDDIKHIYVPRDDYHIKLLTVEQFMDMHFDFILVGNGKSEIPFFNLMKRHKKNSIFIRQIANLKEVPHRCKNVMLSTKTKMPDGVNWVKHLMEQPRSFKYVPYQGEKTIKSYSNYLRLHKNDSAVWDQAKKKLSEFDFKMYGHRNDDKWVRQDRLAESMREAMFIWHTKATGGGGFVCQEALASGRPLIVKKQYAYSQETRAQDYLEDGVNCLDLSVRSMNEVTKLIREWAHPDKYKKRCKRVLKCFEKHFDFEKNSQEIKQWLGTLKPGV